MNRRLVWVLCACLTLCLPAQAAKKKKAGSVRVYRFDNLDIEGRIKTPHLMYFLKRIRSKFRSSRLPKQNFSDRVVESKAADFLK